jgi:phospholipase/carboxylesterase
MTPNPHLEPEPVFHGAALDDADFAVLAVHGRGQSPAFMQDLADRIGLPGFGYLLPAASGNTWYPGGFMQPIEDNQPHLDHALEAIGTHLDGLRARGFGPERTVLLGFSQGACLLSEYLLRHQDRYAAAILHTGGYLGPAEHGWPEEGALDGVPVLLASAAEDAWVPLPRIEATAVALSKAGAAVELTTYDDPEHHINDDAVILMRRLLRALTSKES